MLVLQSPNPLKKMFPLFSLGETLDSWKPWWLMAAAKSLRALENKLQGAWTEERCWAFPLARVNIHSPAARSRGVDWGDGARWLCSPCCFVQSEDSAEAGHEAFSVASWIGKKEHLFLLLFTFFSTVNSFFYQHTTQGSGLVGREEEGGSATSSQEGNHLFLASRFKKLHGILTEIELDCREIRKNKKTSQVEKWLIPQLS